MTDIVELAREVRALRNKVELLENEWGADAPAHKEEIHDGRWWAIVKRGDPPLIFNPYEGFIRWTSLTEYGWREKWRAQEVCDRLFETDEEVSVEPCMQSTSQTTAPE